jgi:hypothetical protein
VTNYITHRVWAKGPEGRIQKLIDDCFSKYIAYTGFTEKQPDFEKIIPRPEAVKQTRLGFRADLGARLLRVLARESEYDEEDDRAIGRQEAEEVDVAIKHFFKKNPEIEKYGRAQLRCLAETGFADWSGWNLRHWGTKWNAFDGKIEYRTAFKGFSEMEFKLKTAVSVPEPVFTKLARLFPDVVFKIAFFGEHWMLAGEGSFNNPGEEDGFNHFAPDLERERGQSLYKAVYGHECSFWVEENMVIPPKTQEKPQTAEPGRS